MKEKDMSHTKLCIRKMNITDDHKRVSKLIYSADDYLYPDLFGRKKKDAYRVISRLLDDQKSIFYYKNYYVAEYCGSIVGIAALHKKQVEWNPKRVKRAFKEEGIEIPDTFRYVSAYYKDVYGKSQSENFKLRNLSIMPKCQHHGVASRLLKRIIKSSKGTPLELWVLTSNHSAIQLYKENEFDKVGNDMLDYGGFVKRYAMARKMVRS